MISNPMAAKHSNSYFNGVKAGVWRNPRVTAAMAGPQCRPRLRSFTLRMVPPALLIAAISVSWHGWLDVSPRVMFGMVLTALFLTYAIGRAFEVGLEILRAEIQPKGLKVQYRLAPRFLSHSLVRIALVDWADISEMKTYATSTKGAREHFASVRLSAQGRKNYPDLALLPYLSLTYRSEVDARRWVEIAQENLLLGLAASQPETNMGKKCIRGDSNVLIIFWALSIIFCGVLIYSISHSQQSSWAWAPALCLLGTSIIFLSERTATEVTVESDEVIQVSLGFVRGDIQLKINRADIRRLVFEAHDCGDGATMPGVFLEVRGIGIIDLPHWSQEQAWLLGDRIGIFVQEVASDSKTNGLGRSEMARIAQTQRRAHQ